MEDKSTKLQAAAMLALDVLTDNYDVPYEKKWLAITQLVNGLREVGYFNPSAIPVTDDNGRFTGLWRTVNVQRDK